MSIFDADSFLSATTTEASVKRPPLPIGDYIGIIGEIKKPREVQGKQDATKTYYFMDVPIVIDLSSRPDLASTHGSKVTITDSVSLDLKDVDGRLVLDMSPGKNARLYRYREACGLNEPGQPFNFLMLTGRQVRAKIRHEPDKNQPQEIYDKIDAISKV